MQWPTLRKTGVIRTFKMTVAVETELQKELYDFVCHVS